MPILTIIQEKARWMPPIPHKLLVNGQVVGIMQKERVQVELPKGQYWITIQSMIPFISASCSIDVSAEFANTLTFSDREHWWDILLGIDMIVSIILLFVTLPTPWDIVYKLISNGYFLAWIIYEWVIRKRYFRFDFCHSLSR